MKKFILDRKNELKHKVFEMSVSDEFFPILFCLFSAFRDTKKFVTNFTHHSPFWIRFVIHIRVTWVLKIGNACFGAAWRRVPRFSGDFRTKSSTQRRRPYCFYEIVNFLSTFCSHVLLMFSRLLFRLLFMWLITHRQSPARFRPSPNRADWPQFCHTFHYNFSSLF